MYRLHFEDLAASLVGGLRMTPVCFEPSQPALVKLEPTHSEQLGNVSCVIRAGKKTQKKKTHTAGDSHIHPVLQYFPTGKALQCMQTAQLACNRDI